MMMVSNIDPPYTNKKGPNAAQILLESELLLIKYLDEHGISYDDDVSFRYEKVKQNARKPRIRNYYRMIASLSNSKIDGEGKAVSKRLAKLKAIQDLLKNMIKDEEGSTEIDDSDDDLDSLDAKAKKKEEELEKDDSDQEMEPDDMVKVVPVKVDPVKVDPAKVDPVKIDSVK